MAVGDPLFLSASELFAHAIEHFQSGSSQDRRFSILHLANAAELILKDVLIDLGETIYKKDGQTLTIHAAAEAVKQRKVSLFGLNKIELLVDERNSLQHRYGTPDLQTVTFYMRAAVAFFSRLFTDHYHLSFEGHIRKRTSQNTTLLSIFYPNDECELEQLKIEARHNSVAAFQAAQEYFSRLTSDFYPKVGISWPIFPHYRGPELLVVYDVVQSGSLLADHLYAFKQLIADSKGNDFAPTADTAISVIGCVSATHSHVKSQSIEHWKEVVAAASIRLYGPTPEEEQLRHQMEKWMKDSLGLAGPAE